MSKIFDKYIRNEDHCWYDSSNILYSVLFDDQTNNPKSLKIVFKGGRTYLYKGVDPIVYTLFKEADSQGKVFNERIKQYDCTKLEDTNLTKLDEVKTFLMNVNKPLELGIHVDINDETGEFIIYRDNMPVFEGIEGQVSIINLFKALNIAYSFDTSKDNVHIQTTIDFETNNIIK